MHSLGEGWKVGATRVGGHVNEIVGWRLCTGICCSQGAVLDESREGGCRVTRWPLKRILGPVEES